MTDQDNQAEAGYDENVLFSGKIRAPFHRKAMYVYSTKCSSAT